MRSSTNATAKTQTRTSSWYCSSVQEHAARRDRSLLAVPAIENPKRAPGVPNRHTTQKENHAKSTRLNSHQFHNTKHPQKVNASIKTALTDQANHEIFASHSYRALSIWCKDNDYNGFAEFFAKQAAEEMEHAETFIEHLLDRGVRPKLKAIDEPLTEFSALLDVAKHAQAMEQQNSSNIHLCYEISQEVKDFPSVPMLLELISEQVEEESWADTMVSLTARSDCPGAAYNLDRHIIKELS